MKKQKFAIALGFFDGVHLGHAKLLERTLEVSREKDLVPTVYTFDRHPVTALTGKSIPLLNSVDDREFILKEQFGIENIIFARFDQKLMNTNWRTFIHDILGEQLNAGHLVAGWDYSFGKNGEGNTELLRSEASTLGIGCDIVDRVVLNGITVSSTHIRNLVADGDMENAALFLGHPHLLSGEVISGKRLGRTLGIPTVNISIPPNIQKPAKGVYVTRVHIAGDERIFTGVTNVGTKPTVTEDDTILTETHIVDFEGNLYGSKIRLEFLQYLRPEIRFPGLEELKKQILGDIKSARELLSSS